MQPSLQPVQAGCLELHGAQGFRQLALTTLGKSRADATCLRTLSATCSWLAFMRSRSCFTACFPRICFSCRCQGIEVRHGKVIGFYHCAQAISCRAGGVPAGSSTSCGAGVCRCSCWKCCSKTRANSCGQTSLRRLWKALHLPWSRAAGKDKTRPSEHAATCCQHTGRQVQHRAAAARGKFSLTSRHPFQFRPLTVAKQSWVATHAAVSTGFTTRRG